MPSTTMPGAAGITGVTGRSPGRFGFPADSRWGTPDKPNTIDDASCLYEVGDWWFYGLGKRVVDPSKAHDVWSGIAKDSKTAQGRCYLLGWDQYEQSDVKAFQAFKAGATVEETETYFDRRDGTKYETNAARFLLGVTSLYSLILCDFRDNTISKYNTRQSSDPHSLAIFDRFVICTE